MLSLSGPAASASHSGGTASWPGIGYMAAHWRAPAGGDSSWDLWICRIVLGSVLQIFLKTGISFSDFRID